MNPFGWGEPSYKDFEVIIDGAALLKSDVSHMETWPDFYVAEGTYLPFEWDCSDLKDAIDRALTGNTWRHLAQLAQATFSRFLFGAEGRELFSSRFEKIVSPALQS